MLQKNFILSELEKQILPLQGLKKLRTDHEVRIDCKAIEHAFPNATFPIGCTHEFISRSIQDNAATNGFITALLGKFLCLGGVCLWISTSRTIFPLSMTAFNIQPEQFIFIDVKNEREVLYATEEALKCHSLTTVIADIKNISFKESRRFQLAAEQSRVTGFIIRQQPRVLNTIASVSRWCVTSVPSVLEDGMPGVGFPRWKVELLKVRNGSPVNMVIEWSLNNFTEIKEQGATDIYETLRKIS